MRVVACRLSSGEYWSSYRSAGAAGSAPHFLSCSARAARRGPTTQSANLYPPQDQGARPPATHAAPLVEIEGDGLESQRPPRRRTDEAPTPDDPTQPYSPNYGSVPAPAQAPPRQPA